MQNFQFPKRENSRIGKVGRITWAVNRDGARGSTTRFCRFKVHVAAGRCRPDTVARIRWRVLTCAALSATWHSPIGNMGGHVDQQSYRVYEYPWGLPFLCFAADDRRQ